jgi:hypothetical protein
MNQLYRLYEASPEAAFAELDQNLAQLEKRLTMISETADGLHRVFESALRAVSQPAMLLPAPARWTYDVRLPNLYFDDVYEPELTEEGAKMWVRRSARLRARLGLPRNVQYDFRISIVDFAVPDGRDSFRIAVDGRIYPWLSTDANVFSTIILEAPGTDGLEFELSLDTDLMPAEDVSFSFSRIDVNRRADGASTGDR